MDLMVFLYKLQQELPDDGLNLPENIWWNATDGHEHIRNHVTYFAHQLYNLEVDDTMPIAYIHGTYAYIEKSSNF